MIRGGNGVTSSPAALFRWKQVLTSSRVLCWALLTAAGLLRALPLLISGTVGVKRITASLARGGEPPLPPPSFSPSSPFLWPDLSLGLWACQEAVGWSTHR